MRPEVNARQRDAPSGELRVGDRASIPRPFEGRMPHATPLTSNTPLDIADAVNDVCPWSGKPIAADSLTLYNGAVVGFCNPECRDKFARAVRSFENALQARRAESAGINQ